jgi:hypothetical protein
MWQPPETLLVPRENTHRRRWLDGEAWTCCRSRYRMKGIRFRTSRSLGAPAHLEDLSHVAPPVIALLGRPDPLHGGGNRLALGHDDVHLTQLGNDLFRRVPLFRHRSLRAGPAPQSRRPSRLHKIAHRRFVRSPPCPPRPPSSSPSPPCSSRATTEGCALT